MIEQVYTVVLILLALLCLLAFPADGGAKGNHTVFVPAVMAARPVLCYVTLHDDGQWSSPQYSLGEPFPPACTFVGADGQTLEHIALYEDLSFGPAKSCK